MRRDLGFDRPYRDAVGGAAYTVSLGGWSPYQESYDLPVLADTRQTYLIATTQRSGSHLLAHAMGRCGAGMPLEYANPFLAELELMRRGCEIDDVERLALLVEIRRRRTTRSGLFGLKAHWHHWEQVIADPTTCALLSPAFVVHLQRRDLLAQAVSLVFARRTGSWISFHEGKAGDGGSFDAPAVAAAVCEIVSEQLAWEKWFKARDITPLRLCFEHVVRDPCGIGTRAARHVGVTPTCPTSTPKEDRTMPRRQRDPVKDEWLAQARERWISPVSPSPQAHCCA